ACVRLRSSRKTDHLGQPDVPSFLVSGPLRDPARRCGVPTSPLATGPRSTSNFL
ncbi:hypothetical protein, partial [Pseudomonas sp. FEN]